MSFKLQIETRLGVNRLSDCSEGIAIQFRIVLQTLKGQTGSFNGHNTIRALDLLGSVHAPVALRPAIDENRIGKQYPIEKSLNLPLINESVQEPGIKNIVQMNFEFSLAVA
jgi:hypothetical protein